MLDEVEESWLNRRYYGGDLPPEAERLLHLAAASHGDSNAALSYLDQAAALAPGHRLVDLGHYKYHFYKANLEEALGYGKRMLGHAMAAIGLNHGDWRAVTRDHAATLGTDMDGLDPAPRLFLFSLTAVGYLLLRLGRLDEGRDVLTRVMELDPKDKFGAARLIAVVDRRGEEEDEP